MADIARVNLIRGDVWNGETFTVTSAGFDFSAPGTVAKMQVRDKPDGTVYLTLTPAVSYPGLGIMTFTMAFTGTQTAAFPAQVLVSDIQISSATFGPYTIRSYQFNILKDVTQ